MSATHGRERRIESASLSALAHPRRRRIVDALCDDGALDVEELAAVVSAWEHDGSQESVDENARQRTMVELIHVDLPVLSDAGLVAYDPFERTVREATGERGEDDAAFADLPPAVVDALANRRRRGALAVLNDRATPLSVTDLACELASEELDTSPPDVPTEYRHSVQAALHHCHLPKLAEVGLVHYDESAHEVERSTRFFESIFELVQPGERSPVANGHGRRGE